MVLKSTGFSAGGVQASPRGLVRLYVHRTAARTPLIAACLQDRPVQAAIPGKGAKWLFFSDGAGHRVKDKQAALSGGGVGDGVAA